MDLHLSISDGVVRTKIYYKRDDLDFDIVNFPFLDGDVSCSTAYGVYISQLFRWLECLVTLKSFIVITEFDSKISQTRFVGCFGCIGPLRQYFSLYRAVSQREGDTIEME